MIRYSFDTEQEKKESESFHSLREKVSVVICTKGRPSQLKTAIASIRNSSLLGSETEIVVVEETSSPRDIPGVRYVPVPEDSRGFGYSRNRGVQEATGDIIVFIDDDCEAERGWLEALVEPMMANNEVVGVAGAVSVRNCGVVGLAENILGFPGGGLRYWHQAQGKVIPTKFLSTCNCAYRRSALYEAGGFQEEARFGGEDFLLAERVTKLGPCFFVPQALVYHRTRDRIISIFYWFIRRGRSESRMVSLTKHRREFITFLLRSSWTLRVLLVFALVIQWPTTMLRWLPVVGGLYGAYILWKFRFALEYPQFRKAWLLVPMVKLTMDVGSEVGRWKGIMNQVRT